MRKHTSPMPTGSDIPSPSTHDTGTLTAPVSRLLPARLIETSAA